jgi:hypothetical protein
MGISRCYNTGAVSAAGGSLTHVGGLSGLAENSVNNSYNTGPVSAADAENAYAGGVVGYHTTGEIINTYNIGDVTAASEGTVYAAGILGFMKNNIWLTLNAAANIKVEGTVSNAANRHVNRVLGGNIGFTPSDVVENFALDVMAGPFTNTGIYREYDRTAVELQTGTTYSNLIGAMGLEFDFCDGTTTRPCGTLYPWKWPTTGTYQYPILYWQDAGNPF